MLEKAYVHMYSNVFVLQTFIKISIYSWIISQHSSDECIEEFTLPAGTNGELRFNLGGVHRVVLCHQEGLKRSAVHKQRHGGELHIQDVVMPLFVTRLWRTQIRRMYLCPNVFLVDHHVLRSPHKAHRERSVLEADLVELPVKLCWFVVLCLGWILAQEEDQLAVVDVQRVVVSVHLCRGECESGGQDVRLQLWSWDANLQRCVIFVKLLINSYIMFC